MIRLFRPVCPDPGALSTNYRHPANKAALAAASFQKCMYCESRVTATYYGDVEHIRPKAKFPALEFDWANLGFVCARCNGHKKDNWDESLPFVDPFAEEPSDHLIALGMLIAHRNGSERGELTCRVIELNRPELREARLEAIRALQNAIDKATRTKNEALRIAILSELRTEISADATEYALTCRAAFSALASSAT